MKQVIRIIPIFILAALVLAACSRSNKSAEDANNGKVLTYTDTAGLAAFQAWKVKNELKDPSVYYNEGASAPVTKTRTVVKKVYAPSKSVSMNSVSQYPAKKAGWSRKAKGAAIGGGAGAILGAVINKRNRVGGGIIGGLLGAGVGYVVGNEMDRKAGRR